MVPTIIHVHAFLTERLFLTEFLSVIECITNNRNMHMPHTEPQLVIRFYLLELLDLKWF